MIDDQNLALVVDGHPRELVDRMRRGRSTVSIGEVRNLVSRYGLTNDGVEARLGEILGDPGIVALARSKSDTRPARVTIRALANLIERATTAIDVATFIPDPRRRPIQVSVGLNEQDVIVALAERIRFETADRVVVLGECLSHAQGLADVMSHPDAIVLTNADLIDPGRKSSRFLNGALHRHDLLVAPRAEMIGDEALARLLDLANRAGARVFIGFATSHRQGVISNGLAAYAADRLSEFANDPVNSDIRGLLASGIIEGPLRALVDVGRIEFESFDSIREDLDASSRLIVCNDRLKRAAINHAAGTIRLSSVEQYDAAIKPGRWIVWEQTDYTRTPPISAGRFGKIFDRLDDDQWIVEIDGSLQQFHWSELRQVRPAHAVSIAEARRAPSSAKLQIELDSPKHAWAAILLAARHEGSATVFVEPKVASNVQELIEVTRRSLRGAPPSVLLSLDAQQTDFEKSVTEAPELVIDSVSEFEPFPMPQGLRSSDHAAADIELPQIWVDRSPTKYAVHPDLWRAILSTPYGRTALIWLEQSLGADATNRGENARRLIDLAGLDTPIADLIRAISGTFQDNGAQDNDADEIPGPRTWTPWQLFCLRYEAFAICYSDEWKLTSTNANETPRPG